ncbi:hypothetical protein SAMN05444004_114105 [Jannaschia faecimaris]|uniref:Uncharacterized protein n=1 Tax=Jannaschia faecimaris TaxID=1244108 RepID=A0A1H3T1W5_9RHOB|nr:hypothetical protein [Jannaschia faecimaris]SDZ43947.1 hypothetical protein SAMN05444004_114105 [Jannaschia faecimaris]
MQIDFIDDEFGAVTVDWVVLTAGLVGLGLAVMAVVSGGVEDISSDMGQTLADTSVEFTFFDDAVSGITDMSTAAILGPDHNEAHRQAMLNDVYPNMSDADLMAYYGDRKAEYDARVGNYGNAVDHIGYAQQEMANRDMGIPDGDRMYSDYAAEYVAENT